jgi:hypothetical protein
LPAAVNDGHESMIATRTSEGVVTGGMLSGASTCARNASFRLGLTISVASDASESGATAMQSLWSHSSGAFWSYHGSVAGVGGSDNAHS